MEQELHCARCSKTFQGDTLVGYCAECQDHFHDQKQIIRARQRPFKGVFADTAHTDLECPKSVRGPGETVLCGLCGSDALEMGYGIGTGYGGMGVYNFCNGCNSFLDFCEDGTGE